MINNATKKLTKKKNDTQKANIFYKKLIYFTTEKSS